MSTTTRYTDVTTATRTETRSATANAPLTFAPNNRNPLPKVFDKAKFE